MVGHAFPIFLGFKGGKAVATFVGAFLYLTPVPMLAALVVFVITVAVTGYISAGSILAAATFPLGVWLILHPTPNELIAAVIAAGIVVYRHQENIERIRAGKESVFRWGKT
jgi:glycerol-3-phosphate acyltransferase PlsY